MSVEEGPGTERVPAALVRSVHRALSVLEILAVRGEATITDPDVLQRQLE